MPDLRVWGSSQSAEPHHTIMPDLRVWGSSQSAEPYHKDGAIYRPRMPTRSSGLGQLRSGRGSGVRRLDCPPRSSQRPQPLRQSLWGARYCLKIRPGLNGPKPTAHEYLSFPCLLIPKNEGSRFCSVGWIPQDGAAAVAFLASDDADFLNGSDITISGGVPAGKEHYRKRGGPVRRG